MEQFFGDFFQLDPVFGESLYESEIKMEEGKMPTQTLYQQEAVEGAMLFRTVCKYELTQQHRSLDETHTRWL